MDMIFVSAQPDHVYFHWQVELYMYQFSKHGIKDKCYAVFGYTDKPSDYIVNLAKTYNIIWYKDDRKNRNYIPSIRPHILKKFFKDRPELGKNVFYHDSDIFLVKLPPFEIMLNDEVGYLSDTVSYIGHNYIVDCSTRYKSKYSQLADNDILTKMCECVGISVDIVKENQINSGGAQYLLKNIDSTYWENVEDKCVKLYDMLKNYESKYPIDHHIQSWTTDMWSVLWEYWKLGKKTAVHPELDFSWAVDSRIQYHKKNIFHLAGVTEKSPKNIFFKGAYSNSNIFDKYRKDKSLFDNISADSSTFEYVSIIKELVDSKPHELKNSIVINSGNHWDGVYERDASTQHFEEDLWRSTNKKYIMFWNKTTWVITATQHEPEISETCGGFASGNWIV